MNKKKNHCDLSSCFLCKLCSSDWNPAIDAHKKTFHFKKGALIFREGDPVTGIYFVFEGTVKVHKDWGPDKELLIRFARKGDIVGHRGLGTDIIYPVSGTALEPTDVCYVDLAFFTSTLKVNPDFLFQLMMFFAAELKESEKRMRNLAHMSVKGRVANALIFFKQKFGTTSQGFINITIRRQDLASYTGTTYETLFRIMNELADEQAIVTDGKQIRITDENILADQLKIE